MSTTAAAVKPLAAAPSFTFTDDQCAAQALLGGPATHVLLEGGSGSGKTMLLLRAVCARALKASGSRHGVLRFRFNHLAASVLADTWPKMLDLCFPGLRGRIKQDRTWWYDTLPNGSEIWWGGLDEKERVEKMLGQEHATLYLNECSQIAWASRGIAVTRLRQQVKCDSGPSAGSMLPLRFYYDCNPPTKGHWLYRLFHQLVDPETRKALPNPENYASMRLNPAGNAANLPAAYLAELQALAPHLRRRFWDGLYGDDNPNQLFAQSTFDSWRVTEHPQLRRVVVAIDPSGADDDHPEADEIGIVAVGLGVDENAYVLEDATMHGGPAAWGQRAARVAARWGADCVVGERNFGGAMVKFTIQTTQATEGVMTRYKEVVASRGKHVRAEPLSALYEQGRVRHVGSLDQLESEMEGFSTTGYKGDGSPNRGDAAVFALTELFPAIANKSTPTLASKQPDPMGGYSFVDEGEDVESWKVA